MLWAPSPLQKPRGSQWANQGGFGPIKDALVMSACVHSKSLQSCLTLWDPTDCIPPGSSVHGILQARILEWVAMLSSRASSQSRNWTHVPYISCVVRWVPYTSTIWEALSCEYPCVNWFPTYMTLPCRGCNEAFCPVTEQQQTQVHIFLLTDVGIVSRDSQCPVGNKVLSLCLWWIPCYMNDEERSLWRIWGNKRDRLCQRGESFSPLFPGLLLLILKAQSSPKLHHNPPSLLLLHLQVD